MTNYRELGKKIYDMNNPREVRRMWVFVMRGMFHNSELSKLYSFFLQHSALKQIITESPFPIEQATRAFFYNKSTFNERCKIIRETFSFFTPKFKDSALINVLQADGAGETLWSMTVDDKMMKARIQFEPGQRKEGLCSVELNMFDGDKFQDHLYQIIFWINKDQEGRNSMYIGAMQGPNMANAKDVVKHMTKVCHGYRTKNLILYVTQAVARALEIEKIYAVTNEGYYANNHARTDRKLKTSFGDFWAEAGGNPTSDSRFYELPLIEARKTIEEVPTRKRAVYRRRFALLDEIDATVADSVKKLLR